jgi:NADH-quinone oxidoreductase subunit J
MIQNIIFYFFAALSVFCAVLVVIQKNVMRSVLYLAFALLSVSGVFFTLHAEFLGAVQILVYAGGIIVLYIFVIIIVNLNEIKIEKRRMFPKFFIIFISILFLAEMIYIFLKNKIIIPSGTEFPDLKVFSEMLLSKYLVPFEVASILLLGVLIGAIIIARRKLLHDSD